MRKKLNTKTKDTWPDGTTDQLADDGRLQFFHKSIKKKKNAILLVDERGAHTQQNI